MTELSSGHCLPIFFAFFRDARASTYGEQFDNGRHQRKIPNDDPNSKANPNFVYAGGALSTDYWSDWLCELALENADRIKSATENCNNFLTLESVQYIFTVCVRLRLPHEVRYTAAVIFEKQITLRMVSAIQIATKEHSYHDSLSSMQVCSCLRSLGFAYTQRAALKSELRILKTLNFKLPKSPLVYAESLLKTLSFKKVLNMDMNTLWQHVQLFLDIVFLHHNEVYHYVLRKVMDDRGMLQSVTKLDAERVKADWMLLGGGIVAAAATCVQGAAEADQTVTSLACISGTPRSDILDMSMGIIETTISLQDARENESKNRRLRFH
uniref:CYCLIN domain-containing protein n=1 Tax=Heterorhabditis bacteriophora TaxID=37862 RepID=A0A1I7XBX8_HETBA